MRITIDNDTKLRTLKGLIALQIEGNGGVTISYRNLWRKDAVTPVESEGVLLSFC